MERKERARDAGREPGWENRPGKYDDIIDLPHHVSARHPQMPALDRAAQFSPFAALAGHGAAIRETARLAEERMEENGGREEPCEPTDLW